MSTTDDIAYDVPVNVKIKGDKRMRKGVTLVKQPHNPERVAVKTGQRGRPAVIDAESIERTTVL